MDVRQLPLAPAEDVFRGLPVCISAELPEGASMLVVPRFDIYGHLDYAATVMSSVLVENVGNA